MLEILRENEQMLDGVDYGAWSHPTLVAVKDGQVEGFIQAHLGAPYAVVTELCVSRAHARKGYGVRLADAMELMLRAAGVQTYVTYASDRNLGMRDMLGRYGFDETGLGVGFVRRLT